MNDKLKQLYKKVILRHSHTPFQYEKNEDYPYHFEAYNPVCGDKFKVYFDLENGKISRMSFHGYGCAISKASTSILVKKCLGKTVDEIADLQREFLAVTSGTQNTEDEEMEAFAAAQAFPGRMQCATLAWEELAQLIER